MTTPPAHGVPKVLFEVSERPPAERLASFRTLTQVLYHAWPREDLDAFDVVSTGYRVGGVVFSQVQFSPMRFRREQQHLQGKEQDFLVLEALLEGTQRVMMDQGHFHLRAGNIYLRDWAHGFDAEGEAMRLHSVLIPRRRLKASTWATGGGPVFVWSMTDPAGRLLFALWSALLAEFEHASLSAAENVVDAFLGFIDALLGHTAAEVMPATLGAMQRFLLVRLQADVGTKDLCTHFHVSRTTVYRLFEPHGGVRRYVTHARMERCFAELYRADPRRDTVSGIAGAWGFFDASSFSRRFKAQFGMPPSAVLGAGSSQRVHDPPDGLPSPAGERFAEYVRWHREATGSGKRAR